MIGLHAPTHSQVAFEFSGTSSMQSGTTWRSTGFGCGSTVQVEVVQGLSPRISPRSECAPFNAVGFLFGGPMPITLHMLRDRWPFMLRFFGFDRGKLLLLVGNVCSRPS